MLSVADQDAWEILSSGISEMSEFSILDSIDVVSISLEKDMKKCDDTASTKRTMMSFKEALIFGAGGPNSVQGLALAKYQSRLPPVSRKPRRPKIASHHDADYEPPPLDLEYYARKAHGAKRYLNNNPSSAAKIKLAQIPEMTDEEEADGTNHPIVDMEEEHGFDSDFYH
mmetsp:Transcript_6233/g.9304  ORF Transcript_6233/g.9304 Transcript_6233/m.9304 type:complete len:170 (-) Transcript_6233:1506-2015(-)